MYFLQNFARLVNPCWILASKISCKIPPGNTFFARNSQESWAMSIIFKNLARNQMFARILQEYARIRHSFARSTKNLARIRKSLAKNVFFLS